MGVENVTFSAVQKGEATIIRLDGEKLGALIGRRGETMESLSYLASLVANRLEGDYIKLGLDVAGFRDKRESDLTALAQRIGAKVRKTGRSFAMEPMNPYERRIIHSAISKMEGVRSESKGEGRDRRVVIYSTAPDAQTENTYGEDTHGKFDPWDYAANKADASGSVAQQATAIKENRTKTTLVVDAGDTIQANSAELFLNDDLHPMIAAMNAIGYDIWTTGNHEYNYGMDVLKRSWDSRRPRCSPATFTHRTAPAGRRLHHHQKGHRQDRCHWHGHPQHHPLGCQESGGLEGHQPCGREPQDHR